MLDADSCSLGAATSLTSPLHVSWLSSRIQEAEMALTGALLAGSKCKDMEHTQGAAEALLAQIAQ